MNTFRKTPNSGYTLRPQQVRLIDEDGTMIGIVAFKEAQDLANQKGLDLIEVSPDTDPPVCKIADYGRLQYKEQKKKNEMKKNRTIVLLKEIQLRPSIQDHDYQVKLNNARNFLQEKNRVKITLQFRGREVSFLEMGKKVLDRMIENLADLGKIENPPKLEGKKMCVVIAPVKSL